MDFVSKLLQGIAFIPAVVNGIEGLFGSRSRGKERRGNVFYVGRPATERCGNCPPHS